MVDSSGCHTLRGSAEVAAFCSCTRGPCAVTLIYRVTGTRYVMWTCPEVALL